MAVWIQRQAYLSVKSSVFFTIHTKSTRGCTQYVDGLILVLTDAGFKNVVLYP